MGNATKRYVTHRWLRGCPAPRGADSGRPLRSKQCPACARTALRSATIRLFGATPIMWGNANDVSPRSFFQCPRWFGSLQGASRGFASSMPPCCGLCPQLQYVIISHLLEREHAASAPCRKDHQRARSLLRAMACRVRAMPELCLSKPRPAPPACQTSVRPRIHEPDRDHWPPSFRVPGS